MLKFHFKTLLMSLQIIQALITCKCAQGNKDSFSSTTCFLKIDHLAYDSTQNVITYCIVNQGDDVAEDIQLAYENISNNDVEKLATLNNQLAGVVNIPNLPADSSTGTQTLSIDLKSATKATFKFTIICKSGTSNAHEETFTANVPALKFKPLTHTKLIGTDKLIKFKIAKDALYPAVSAKKLKLNICNALENNAAIQYKGKEITDLSENELGSWEEETYEFILIPYNNKIVKFKLQLCYEKTILDTLAISWSLEMPQAIAQLFELIKNKDNPTNVDQIKQLLQTPDIDVNAKDGQNGYSLLYKALEASQEDIVKLLLEAGANVNDPSSYIITPLYAAIQVGNPKIVKLLIDHGVDVNLPIGGSGNTPLMQAVCKSNLDVVNELLAVPNIQINTNYNGLETGRISPIYQALISDNEKIFSALMAKGADLNEPLEHESYLSENLLSSFIQSKEQEKMKRILREKTLDVNRKDRKGNTPLDYALINEDPSAVLALLQREDIDLDKITYVNKQDIWESLFELNLATNAIMEACLQKGLAINAQNEDGNTALHLAVKHNQSIDVIQFLLQAGANKSIHNKAGERPLDLVLPTMDKSIADLLIAP